MKNILILTYWSYKNALIQTYTLPYVRIIRKSIDSSCKIFLLTLEQDFFKMTDKEWETEKNKLAQENIILIRFKYDYFGFKMIVRIIFLLFTLIKIVKKEKIDIIHTWCTPAGALGYLLSVITSKPLIIDSYEPHAEAMVENGTWNKSSLKFKLLFWLEKKQSQKAETAIALTQGMAAYAKTTYNATFKNYYVKPALVDLDQFKWNINSYRELREKQNLDGKIVCVYAGKIGGIYLEEEVFDFFKVASEFWGEKLQIFLLTDKNIDEVNALVQQKNIPNNCIETLFVPFNEIQNYYQIADFAINPVKPVSSKRYCTSIKDGEYWAMGLPVVITKNISDDSQIIEEEDIGYVLNELTSKEYYKACTKIEYLIKDKGLIHQKIRTIAIKYRSFDIANEIYEKIYH